MPTAVALRPIWLAGIAECKGARKVTTESFLNSRNAHVNTSPAEGKFTLYISNPKKIIEYFAHEADRFSSAAFESLIVEVPRPEFPRSVGWLLIRGYYSAFFALHSLMRLHGWACTRLPKEISSKLDRDAKMLFLEAERIDQGLYLIKAGNRSPEINFMSLGGVSGGSHEALWSILFEFLAEVTNSALESPTDEEASRELVASVSKFRALIIRNGGPIWLTRVRNRINYMHEYGVWHPYERSTCDASRIIKGLERWRAEPSAVFSPGTSDELIQFCEACSFLVSLCRTTMEDLIFRSAGNSPFRLSTGRLLPQTFDGRAKGGA